MLDFDTALQQLLQHARPSGATETVPLRQAEGRVLAVDLRSPVDVPGHDNSAMDGYAVRVAGLRADPSAAWPVSQRIAAGHFPQPLQPGTVARIFTGAAIPDGADAVVMQEQAHADASGGLIRFDQVPADGESIRRRGEDVARDAVVLQAGTRLGPQHVGLAASVGAEPLVVHRRVRVACFFTGDELVMPGVPLQPGQIYNSNRYLLTALLERLGCDVRDLGPVPDSLQATRDALAAASDADLIVTSGGVSVGDEDHVRPAVEAEGSLELWRIAMKPGKPLAYGRVRRRAAADLSGADASPDLDAPVARGDAGDAHFIGLPGNPVSAFVTFLMLVRPFVLRLQGCRDVAPPVLPMTARFDWSKPDRRREFLRVRLLPDGSGLQRFEHQGSGVLTSTVWADGLVDVPPGQVIRPGDPVRYLPLAGLLDG